MTSPARKTSLGTLLAATVVLLVAAYLRLHLLASVPYGWHPDEAIKAVMASEILAGQRAIRPFYPSYTGREPLYIWMEAVSFALMGQRTFTTRVLSAFIGLLTIALTYNLGKRMFNRRVAWLAAGFIAVSVWHVIASRNGYRAVLQPLVQLPALIFTWRGLKSKQWRDFAIAGGFVGLAQYTYSAARFFPVLLLIFGGVTLVARRAEFKRAWLRWAIMGLAALVVFAPLGIYFARHPEDLTNRANQISVFNEAVNGGDTATALLENLRDTGLMFFTKGDPNYRFNLGDRPVFTPVEAILFGAGLALALWAIVRRRALPYILLWLQLIVMAAPMILTVEGIPYFQRALGILPAIFFFPALALDVGLDALPEGLRQRSWIWRLGLGAGLLALAAVAYNVYFVQWANAPQAYTHRRSEQTQLAEYINALAPDAEHAPYISTDQGLNPAVRWFAPDYFPDLHWFDASQTMVYPSPGRETEYIFMAQTTITAAVVELSPDLTYSGEELDPYGRPAFVTYHWPADGRIPEPENTGPLYWSAENAYPELQGDTDASVLQPLEAPVNLGNDVDFLGYNLIQDAFVPGQPMEVILFWRINNLPDHLYQIFVHLVDYETTTYANGDANLYLTWYWSLNETFTGHHVLWLPEDMPPGEYLLQIGMYDPDTGERATVYDADGAPVDARILIGPFTVGE